MRLLILIFTSIFCLAMLIPEESRAQDGGSRFNYREKASTKADSRWSLADWLAQKDRNKMMDLWLAMYSPSPYEYYLTGTYNSYKTSVDPTALQGTSHTSYSGGFGAYATVVGLEGLYENNTAEGYNDLTGAVNVRIAGNAVQGTHVNVFYGLRTRHQKLPAGATLRLNQPFFGGELDLYLMRHFGVHGKYQHFQKYEDGTLGTLDTTRSEGGAFIDFSAFRVYGNYFREKEVANKFNVITTTEREGISSGFKFFF